MNSWNSYRKGILHLSYLVDGRVHMNTYGCSWQRHAKFKQSHYIITFDIPLLKLKCSYFICTCNCA
jgi:hypothetical protein